MPRATSGKTAASSKPAATGKTTITSPPAPQPAASAAPTISSESIAMRAYDKWRQRGQPDGTQMQDWLEAEKELLAEAAKPAKTAPSGKK